MRIESGGAVQLRGKVADHARREHTCTDSCFERVRTAEKESMMLTDDERRAELPVETELVDGAWYSFPDGTMELFRPYAVFGDDVPPLYRMASVARYEPRKTEVAEPKGLGAVVRDSYGAVWVRTVDDEWAGARCLVHWKAINQPVEVLSEGVEL